MDEVPVVTCFLREGGEVLLLRRSDAVGSYAGAWGAVAGHVASDGTDPTAPDRDPLSAARAEIREETGLADATLVRAGEPFPVADADLDRRWVVHPFLFEVGGRDVEPNRETAAVAWVPPTAILARETVPRLWTSYDRVRPRVATITGDREHGSTWLSVRALEVLRDEAGLAAVGRHEADERAERDGDDWAALASLARRLRDARPAMVVVANRVNRAMRAAAGDGTPAALRERAHEHARGALDADRRAATLAAERLPERVATLSRSGTALTALRERDPSAVLVAESRPGREGVGVAEALADSADVTLTTDAAFPGELASWSAGALVVGADRMLPDGRVLNKVGTRGAALAAPADCPTYVVAASDKVAPDDAVDREARDPAEVYDGDADLAVANPTFEVTPAGAVDAVLTERGALSADDVATLAAEHRAAAEW
ncbi:MAG: NUDIX domain-containing protein [Haloarculaceae archaeon]